MDSLVHDEKAFQFLRSVIGDDKICLGSDYPFPLGEEKPGRLIEQMKLSGEITDRIFYRNALQWLGIS